MRWTTWRALSLRRYHRRAFRHPREHADCIVLVILTLSSLPLDAAGHGARPDPGVVSVTGVRHRCGAPCSVSATVVVTSGHTHSGRTMAAVCKPDSAGPPADMLESARPPTNPRKRKSKNDETASQPKSTIHARPPRAAPTQRLLEGHPRRVRHPMCVDTPVGR